MARYGTELAFGAHLHSHLELVYMIAGRAKARVDSKEYIIESGDLFLVFPNQVHEYIKIGKERFVVSIFPSELCPEFRKIFRNKLPESPIVRNLEKNSKLFKLLHQIVSENEQESTCHDAIMKGYYLILLGEIFQMMQFRDIKSSDSDTIKLVLNYCMENYNREIHLDMVADTLHISKYYISHLFTDKLHIGFREYIGTLRVSEACLLLSTSDKTITEIAYDVGFSSTRSFNRVFLKYIGMTPSQYKKKLYAGEIL